MDPLQTRTAVCHCGDLKVTMQGHPTLVSSCCCTRCQRRTGGFFGVTVYYHPDQMLGHEGAVATFHRPDGTTTFHFCPRCGSNLWWVPDHEDDVIGVAGGAFADPTLPSPERMVFTEHRHPFVRVPAGVREYW
jgi:hypothetical protein